jgi:hypothetical protein
MQSIDTLSLSGQEFEYLLNALVSGYPKYDDLRLMVRIKLNQNLDTIVAQSSLQSRVFELIGWAEARGMLGNLVEGAIEYNKGNYDLRNLHTRLLTSEQAATMRISACRYQIQELKGLVTHELNVVQAALQSAKRSQNETQEEIVHALALTQTNETRIRLLELRQRETQYEEQLGGLELKLGIVVNISAQLKNLENRLAGIEGQNTGLFSDAVDTVLTEIERTRSDLAVAMAEQLSLYARASTSSDNLSFHVKVVHALTPARDFQLRPELEQIHTWWKAPDAQAILGLIGIGGSGKTALLRHFLAQLPNGLAQREVVVDNSLMNCGALFVWSFYEDASTDAFLAALHDYVDSIITVDEQRHGGSSPLGSRLGPSVGLPDSRQTGRSNQFRTVELIQTLMEKRPKLRLLVVIDGLERIQEEASESTVLGAIPNLPLRQFLRRVADGLGSVRVIVTSRYPLSDLYSWKDKGYLELGLDQLPMSSCIGLLRYRGVNGSDAVLRSIIDDLGRHALTLDLLSHLLVIYFSGDAGRVNQLPSLEKSDAHLDLYGELQSRRLRRIFRYYEEHLPTQDVALLRIVSCFRFSVRLSDIQDLVKKPEVRKILGTFSQNGVRKLLSRLSDRGLVYIHGKSLTEYVTSHPAIREYFYQGMNQAKLVHREVYSLLSRKPVEGLASHDDATIDLFEEMVFHAARSGDNANAYSIYQFKIGGFGQLGSRRGEYVRGATILRLFIPNNQKPPGTPKGLTDEQLSSYYLEVSQYAGVLGELKLAISSLRSHLWRLGSTKSIHLFNLHLLAGELSSARELASKLCSAPDIGCIDTFIGDKLRDDYRDHRRAASEESEHTRRLHYRLAYLVAQELTTGTDGNNWYLESQIPLSDYTWYECGHHIALKCALRRYPTEVLAAILQEESSNSAFRNSVHRVAYQILIARALLMRGSLDESHALTQSCKEWAFRTSHQEILANSYLLLSSIHETAGRHELASTSVVDASRIAEECGFRLLYVECLVQQSRLELRNDVQRAIVAAKSALSHAEGPGGTFIWGVADAACLLGQAFVLLGQHADGQVQLTRALSCYRKLGIATQ